MLEQVPKMLNMKIDIHVHLADIEALQAARNAGQGPRGGYLARVLRWVDTEQSAFGCEGSLNERWNNRLASWVRECQLDHAVLLALDRVFDASGVASPRQTLLQVDNDFVASVAAQHPEFIFGASIHPYRKDAIEELERLLKKGARLVKWIPSSQHIEPDHPLCLAFYEALAHYHIPLLSHTGVEHTLGSRRSYDNHPQRLIPALERGVSVIAAHCGEHLYLHEPSFFKAWVSMARTYEHFYGDSGAFSVVTRIPALRTILKDPLLRTKLLYGSDFPGIPAPHWCWQLGFSKMRELSKMTNPLARNMQVMKALGTPEEVFDRAHQLLGIRKESA
jgi:predicted TIM-barrel fold metal-dependent hydrolase